MPFVSDGMLVYASVCPLWIQQEQLQCEPMATKGAKPEDAIHAVLVALILADCCSKIDKV